MAHDCSRAPARRPPVFVTQQRGVLEFLADTDRLLTIKSGWLYELCPSEEPQVGERLFSALQHRPPGTAKHGMFPPARMSRAVGVLI